VAHGVYINFEFKKPKVGLKVVRVMGTAAQCVGTGLTYFSSLTKLIHTGT